MNMKWKAIAFGVTILVAAACSHPTAPSNDDNTNCRNPVIISSGQTCGQ
jgi:hypothetical protein